MTTEPLRLSIVSRTYLAAWQISIVDSRFSILLRGSGVRNDIRSGGCAAVIDSQFSVNLERPKEAKRRESTAISTPARVKSRQWREFARIDFRVDLTFVMPLVALICHPVRV